MNAVIDENYCGARHAYIHSPLILISSVHLFVSGNSRVNKSSERWRCRWASLLNQPRVENERKKRKFQSHLFGESFSSYARAGAGDGRERSIDYRWNCLYYRQFTKKKKKETTQNRRKVLRFMIFNNFFFVLFFCFLKEIPFPLLAREEKYLNKVVSYDGNLHTEGPLSNHNCAFQLHHVTKFLNVSRLTEKKQPATRVEATRKIVVFPSLLPRKKN